MTAESFDRLRSDDEGENPRQPSGRWRNFRRWFKSRLPTGLYARSLLIIILPMLILQTVVTVVFMERHWRLISEQLSQVAANEVAAIVKMVDASSNEEDLSQVIDIARDQLGITVTMEPAAALPAQRNPRLFDILGQILITEVRRRMDRPIWVDTIGQSPLTEVRTLAAGRTIRIFLSQRRTAVSNSHIFIVWMVSTAVVLMLVAIGFLRGQIRPIQALARAAESFGRGQKLPEGFSPRGADEVRRAGLAFILMRERIERQMEQRTAMLAGVSHDLRTILTRFRLQLAVAGDHPDLRGLSDDVEDMQAMLEGYMAFARGESEEDFGTLDLAQLFERLTTDAALQGRSLTASSNGDMVVTVRPNAFARLITNIVSNALRYGSHVDVQAMHHDSWLKIVIDDDGPGIPPDRREDVFKPFFRLDEARNLDSSGTGLGLAIARDIARSHGGNVVLDDSPLGGLRAIIRVPV